MRIILKAEDLQLLRLSEALPADHLNLVEEHFNQLKEGLQDGETDEAFSLEEHGYIVYLEKGDNARSLPNVGLPDGILDPCVEWVDRLPMGEGGITILRAAFLCNNEFVLFVYVEEGAFGQDIDEFLLSHVVPDVDFPKEEATPNERSW